MRESPKNKVSFDISGLYLRELKIVLKSQDVREDEDYLDSKFDEKRLTERRHLLMFFRSRQSEPGRTDLDAAHREAPSHINVVTQFRLPSRRMQRRFIRVRDRRCSG